MLIWGALFVLAAYSVAVSGYAIKNRNKLEQLEASLSEKMAQFNRELEAVNNGAIGVGQHLIHVEKKLNTVVSEQERLLTTAEFQPYGQAEAMAEQGVDAEQLSERFGLSESEAQLMSMIKQRSAAQAL
ncbi:DUF2802 domain-containing protein [Dasania sp. GY-MA-18]|uniref:DUF2802 domain-containing protein n=1 Tax=Dasania phycosphaerae TaxID=2950436 RepID=A0A9J6RIE5_9GAMM|nr:MULTISPECIES: DUF2802 domain-containing protein [Dasania]MCR8921685.1 DUF2802 domain-containing protein [Dasania sp. GY-MA-18]MCZ0864113.1 DUF2802 domain-containing protein [Dasania phycosphaerae]MCZ0867841.1 DUF2802 domain-containing protein [Dasania phycosphaerae]